MTDPTNEPQAMASAELLDARQAIASVARLYQNMVRAQQTVEVAAGVMGDLEYWQRRIDAARNEVLTQEGAASKARQDADTLRATADTIVFQAKADAADCIAKANDAAIEVMAAGETEAERMKEAARGAIKQAQQEADDSLAAQRELGEALLAQVQELTARRDTLAAQVAELEARLKVARDHIANLLNPPAPQGASA